MKSLKKFIKLSFVLIMGVFFLVATKPTPKNPLKFISSKVATVPENQTDAITLEATGKSAPITYAISGGDSASFNINSTSGKVTFKTAPDYETKNIYSFTASATDSKNNKATQEVTIKISDVNEENLTDDTNINNNEDNDNIKTYNESYNLITERLLAIDLSKYKKKWSYVKIETEPKIDYITYNFDGEKNMLYYIPPKGYIGNIKLIISDGYADLYPYRTVKINVDINYIKPPVSKENMDYTLALFCDYSSPLNYPQYYTVKIIDDELKLKYLLYDNYYYNNITYGITKPKYSRMILDYNNSAYTYMPNGYRYGNLFTDNKYYGKSRKHQEIFKKNIDKQVKITCTYPNGYFDMIYPIDSKFWYATKPNRYVSPAPPNIIYSSNDLFFYISILSDLHSKIYLATYEHSLDRDFSYEKANEFMEKVFPNSHYQPELIHNFNLITQKFDYETNFGYKFTEDNKLYIDNLKNLANELTGGNLNQLIDKIVENYKSYYLSGEKICKDNALCGILFPEYTQNITSNHDFSSGMDSWIINKNLVEPAVGKIEFIPNKQEINMEYRANRQPNNDNWSSMELYKIEDINRNSIDDYFINFDLNRVYGGAEGGHPTMMCWESSGFTGVYVSFNDKDGSSLGWIALSDHCNKADIGWGVKKIVSNSRFYNVRIHDVFRRFKPKRSEHIFKLHLSTILKNHLPDVYKEKDKIKSIEYGIFATEFRNSYGGCYFCETKLRAKDISLYKKK